MRIKPHRGNIRFWQIAVLAAVIAVWYVLTSPTLLPTFYFNNPTQAAFFFGERVGVEEAAHEVAHQSEISGVTGEFDFLLLHHPHEG